MALPLATGTWTLDASHTTVGFTVRHMGISKVRGTFTGVEARLIVAEPFEASLLTAQVDMSTVDTGNADRDAHLRSPDFFDVESFPFMAFTSTAIREDADGGLAVEGELTVKGRSKPFALEVVFEGTQTYPMDGSTHAGFSATGSLSRKEFGIEFNVPLASGGFVIADRISIDLDVQLTEADPSQRVA